MGITVKHSTNPSAVLTAAYGAGRELERKRVGEEALKAAEARRARVGEQEFQREMLGRRQEFQQQVTEGSREFEREMMGTREQFARERMGIGEQFARERMLLGADIGLQDYEWRLTAQQRTEREKILTGINELRTSDAYTDEEREIGLKRLYEKLVGVEQGTFVKKEPSPYPEGQRMGDVWSQGGHWWTRDESGIPKRAGEDRSQPTWQDRIKIGELALKRYEMAMGMYEAQEIDESGKPPKTLQHFLGMLPEVKFDAGPGGPKGGTGAPAPGGEMGPGAPEESLIEAVQPSEVGAKLIPDVQSRLKKGESWGRIIESLSREDFNALSEDEKMELRLMYEQHKREHAK